MVLMVFWFWANAYIVIKHTHVSNQERIYYTAQKSDVHKIINIPQNKWHLPSIDGIQLIVISKW